ncbi:TatD family hydrolase [Alicyclobacillus sp. ALC3]|uniref:TatD family hydrolase n=1 Tax=Alicyclobacillus sp. ALC3 TaxID=2796143 RepID=UPI002379A13A|nr:TatD family hydrolase [Alicyclobacillus sp. ALC3]WDL99008.1 TatD family hydrolase [Alicyclobacillus sp. ALC3]
MLFDSHCHLNDDQFADDLADVLTRARAVGIKRIVVPGVDVASSQRAIWLAEQEPEVFAAVGIHPEAAKDVPDEDFAQIESLTSHPKVVAVGEIGLDYYWDAAPRPEQQDVLRRQLELAERCRLPVILHNRESTADLVAMIESFRGRVTGVMHCFNESEAVAKRCLDLGYYISFGGPVTFKKADDVRAVAQVIPADRLLAETDSPYLSPTPLRGKRNEPERVALVVAELARVRGQDTEEVARQTAENALRLFAKVTAL